MIKIRKQYHLKKSENGFYAWDVHKLIEKSKNFPIIEIELSEINEFYENFWYQNNEVPSCHSVVEHMKLINEASLDYPIILTAEGTLMDGMHRVGKAYLEGHKTIKAVKFEITPEPDFIDVFRKIYRMINCLNQI